MVNRLGPGDKMGILSKKAINDKGVFTDSNREFVEAFNVYHDGEMYNLKPKMAFNPIYFTKRELRLLSEISSEYLDTTATAMIEITHKEYQPWHKTLTTNGDWSPIDHNLILNKTSENYHELIENIRDRKIIETAFNEVN